MDDARVVGELEKGQRPNRLDPIIDGLAQGEGVASAGNIVTYPQCGLQ